ncbi:hypothetical protein [Sphingomonas adhaesiva]|uniref:hypothetical protein n=1 Tax=Sphingomonas adhaesiva TaxID=28212 RepID=UPI002FF4AB88
MSMEIKPAQDRQGLINLSASIEADAGRIAALAECILETICNPDVTSRQLALVDALANTVKIMADRVSETAAKVEAFASRLPEENVA